jgi:light-independent protochlorophyllide reductase subunit B
VVAPLGRHAGRPGRLTEADFNVVLYPETACRPPPGCSACTASPHHRPCRSARGATREFIAEVAQLAGRLPSRCWPIADAAARAPWYSRSVDSTYLTGKRVFVFGDATHAIAAARVASQELGFTVVGLGTYSREFAREVREAAKLYGVEALITDDYLEVEARIAELQPELVLGTQMERHIAKRLGVPCAVISAPVHVQDFPARYSPQMGFEGANVLFDTWVHPLMMGLEEHLLTMFRDDFEFHDGARAVAPGFAARAPPPRHGGQRAGAARAQAPPCATVADRRSSQASPARGRVGPPDAQKELQKIPFFVRGKARRNTEALCRPNAAWPRSPSRRCMTPKRTSAARSSAGLAGRARQGDARFAAQRLRRPPRCVVLVTMDSHLASAASARAALLRASCPACS